MRRSLWLVILSLPALALPAGAAGDLTVDELRDMTFAKGAVTIKEIEVDASSGEIVKIKRHRPEAAGVAAPPLAWGVKAQRYPHPFKP